MNTDISGLGVRVSFYLQTVFLGCLSARSTSPEEVTGALYTLLATNTGMAVTAFHFRVQVKTRNQSARRIGGIDQKL
ncbi:hypothetical protein B0H14DRAFT_2867619, partial [Mycena olivaceomarginata]